MNERIRELAMQTDRECEHLGQSDIGEDWVEKFAQLIVQECIEVSEPRLTDVGEWSAGMRQVQKRIKEHFGVN